MYISAISGLYLSVPSSYRLHEEYQCLSHKQKSYMYLKYNLKLATVVSSHQLR